MYPNEFMVDPTIPDTPEPLVPEQGSNRGEDPPNRRAPASAYDPDVDGDDAALPPDWCSER